MKIAESKLNTIASHVSNALRDGVISDEEFKLVLDEVEKYASLKMEVKSKAHKYHQSIKIDDQTKNELIQRGRQRGSIKISFNLRI